MHPPLYLDCIHIKPSKKNDWTTISNYINCMDRRIICKFLNVCWINNSHCSSLKQGDSWYWLVKRCQLHVYWSLQLGTFVTWFPSEPLYQTYRATVITKEIRRQTVCRNISKTSADYAMDWTARRSGTGTSAGTGNGALRSSPVPTPVQSTLWQDLPSVRDSGVLELLTPEHCKYQEVRGWCEDRREANVQRRDYMKRNQWREQKWNGRCCIKF